MMRLSAVGFVQPGLLACTRLPISSPRRAVDRLRFTRAAPSTAQWTATMAPTATGPALKKHRLGNSDLIVTEVCLGTMTWGVQNTEEDAHEQLDYAIKERGVNFIDTAEIYPVPSTAPGHQSGLTEKYIGTWLAKNPEWRERVIIATKVMGYSKNSKTAANRTDPPQPEPWPDTRLDEKNILAACEGSLRRLQTDYIDLYQTHWPDRYVPLWGNRAYNPKNERDELDFKSQLMGMKKLIDEGKVKNWGVSNETSYGLGELIKACDEIGMPRPVSIQNQFCLLNRSFEFELAEACAPSHYNIGLLPWSPLAGGALSGKYKVDESGNLVTKGLEKSRFVLFPFFQGRFLQENNRRIVDQYQKLAEENGISLAKLALSFCATRWYTGSTIIGATSMAQLTENIDAFAVDLSDDVLKKIDEIHNSCLDPFMSV